MKQNFRNLMFIENLWWREKVGSSTRAEYLTFCLPILLVRYNCIKNYWKEVYVEAFGFGKFAKKSLFECFRVDKTSSYLLTGGEPVKTTGLLLLTISSSFFQLPYFKQSKSVFRFVKIFTSKSSFLHFYIYQK